MIDRSDIEAAARNLRDRVVRTPILPAPSLGDRVGVELHLKCENLQKTGSFKPRGALNKILSLTSEERDRGVITVSAGNHAQAVAWAAGQVGASSVVVMPDNAPRPKQEAVRAFGAEAVLHDDRPTLFDRMWDEQKKRGSVFVHPFDDPVVLAGAGTTGLEIVEDLPGVDWVVVPVGGGGLMSGVASAVKAVRPDTRILAVELAEGPGLGPALKAGKPVPVPRPSATLADGLIPPFVGEIPVAIAREAVDDLVTVTETEIEAAVVTLFTEARLIAEGAGAVATAALLAGKVTLPEGSRVVSVVSGGNLDLEVLRRLVPETATRPGATA